MTRRMSPAERTLRAEARAVQVAEYEQDRAWLASLSPGRTPTDVAADRRMQSLSLDLWALHTAVESVERALALLEQHSPDELVWALNRSASHVRRNHIERLHHAIAVGHTLSTTTTLSDLLSGGGGGDRRT
jgi:hypothetical protein